MLIAVVIALLLCLSPSDDDSHLKVKYDVTAGGYFDIAHDASGTQARGTYYETIANNQLHLTIVTDVVVGSKDFGGITFNFGSDMKIINVLTNDSYSSSIPVSVWVNGRGDSNTSSIVSICRGSVNQPYGYWAGTVVIELTLIDEDYSSFLISAGSLIQVDGTPVIGPSKLEVII